MEDQLVRISCLLRAVYVWELMEEVSVFSKTEKKVAADYSNCSGIVNVLPLRKMQRQRTQQPQDPSVKKVHRREKGTQRKDKSSRGSVGSAYSTQSSLGDNWRFLVDALSLHPQSRHYKGVTIQFRTDRSIQSSAYASESTATSKGKLSREGAISSDIGATFGVSNSRHNSKGKRQRGQQNNSGAESKITAKENRPKIESRMYKTPIRATTYLLSIDISDHRINFPEPQRFVDLLKLHIVGKLNIQWHIFVR
jgi:hypothetical protein